MIWMATNRRAARRSAAALAAGPLDRDAGHELRPEHDPLAILQERSHGAISIYAQSHSDYHDVIKRRLKTLARWLVAQAGGDVKVFVDTAAVMEKATGGERRSRLAGKHTNLVSHELGSWLFLGALFTTLELPPDERRSGIIAEAAARAWTSVRPHVRAGIGPWCSIGR